MGNGVTMGIIEKYVEYGHKCTKTDDEFHRFCGYVLVSQTVVDRLVMRLPHGTYRPNLWLLLIGPSTLSRKTTAMYLAMEILEEAGLENFMPTDFSPEGLIDFMEKMPRGYMWLDEVSSLFASSRKDYMSGSKELMMKLYSGKSVHKELVKGTKFIKDPSLGIVGTTTPQGMQKTFGTEDMFSGYGARFLHIYHSCSFEWRAMQWLDQDTIKKQNALIQCIKDLRLKFQAEKEAKLSDEALDLFNEWDEELFELLSSGEALEELNSLYGRLVDYVLKLAMVIEVSESWQSIKIADKEITISESSMERAIHEMNTYRTQVSFRVIKMLHGSDRMYIYEKIDKKGPIDRSTLLRMTHMKAKDLSDELDTLIQMGLVEIKTVTSGGRPKTVYQVTSVGLLDV